MLFTSGNIDFWIESFRDINTYDRRSSTGISQELEDGNLGQLVKYSLLSLDPTSLSKGIWLFSKFDCSWSWAFGNTRAGILSNIFGRFSCWALTVSSNEYEGGSFQPGVYAKKKKKKVEISMTNPLVSAKFIITAVV